MYSGFYISFETPEKAMRRFVTPAIVAETVAALITQNQADDPSDSIAIRVYWGNHSMRPAYTVDEAMVREPV